MLKRKKESLIVIALVAALLVVAVVAAFPVYVRYNAIKSGDERVARVLPIALSSFDPDPSLQPSRNSTASVSNPAFVAAASRNVTLGSSLDWLFGGKQQRGWSIYLPLITRTLDTNATTDSTDFAQAVARWQKAARLQPTGVLDRADWMQMIAGWQTRRLRGAAYPDASQLVSIPSSELYDPNRPADMRLVERTTYAAYKRLLAAATSDRSLGLKTNSNGELADSEKFLKVVSAFRSREHQDRLRREQPEAGRAALATNSPHFTGRALDLYVGGYDPVSTKDDNRALQTQTKAYKWLVNNAERFNFRPYFYEPWHWEYVGN
ncbi:MAG: zinc D-Ala-D-Ala carboxypeptidase [Acidobacteriota bacterium]|nr:zinc D-Ala-D-Ala carboxypeptidase [Acidobacteriota bacterium]